MVKISALNLVEHLQRAYNDAAHRLVDNIV